MCRLTYEAASPACPQLSTPRRLRGKQLWKSPTPKFAESWNGDPLRIPGLDEDQQRLALELATRALEPDPPQPVWQARAKCSFQRKKWIWQICVRKSGHERVVCQIVNNTNKDAGRLRA